MKSTGSCIFCPFCILLPQSLHNRNREWLKLQAHAVAPLHASSGLPPSEADEQLILFDKKTDYRFCLPVSFAPHFLVCCYAENTSEIIFEQESLHLESALYIFAASGAKSELFGISPRYYFFLSHLSFPTFSRHWLEQQ